VNIEAGSGHSAIEKSEETERCIRRFEAAPCIGLTVPGVAFCCKTPGNLKSVRRDGDIVKYECVVCHRKHNVAFSEPGTVALDIMRASCQRSYEIGAAPADASGCGSEGAL
jgi:hypothetical protein